VTAKSLRPGLRTRESRLIGQALVQELSLPRFAIPDLPAYARGKPPAARLLLPKNFFAAKSQTRDATLSIRWRRHPKQAQISNHIAVMQIRMTYIFNQRACLPVGAVGGIASITHLFELLHKRRLVYTAFLNGIRPLRLLPGRARAVVLVRVRHMRN